MATYAIGDLQGCLEPFQQLLKRIRFNTDCDRLWLVGDLINRGPQSLETLRLVHNMRDNIDCVLGNHDLHLLAVANGIRPPSRGDTLDDILSARDSDTLLQWLRHLPLIHRSHKLNAVMVHAGIPPCWTADEAEQRADEIHTLLRGRHFSHFLSSMYGNEPALWQDHLQGSGRWRLITNYFTRMRFCSPEGELELQSKGDSDNPPRGYAPWFSHPRKEEADPQVIFGHWAALVGQTTSPWASALDTGCVWGGQLSALCLETNTISSCDCPS